MDIGEKMKARRLELGLSLEAVGNIVGVGKSTVRKWENGLIKNMGRDKIALVAQALRVTPGYLMGWEDEYGNEIPNTPNESDGARRVSAGYDRMPPDMRKAFFAYLDMSVFAPYFKDAKED